jgi:predicted flap endonuclease-1-like 5' DNA nuclease
VKIALDNQRIRFRHLNFPLFHLKVSENYLNSSLENRETREKYNMRSDYTLYVVAVIFFVLTTVVSAYQVDFREVWVVTTAVLGLLSVGLGYSQRPKPQPIAAATSIETPTATVAPVPPQATSAVTEVAEPKPIAVTETIPRRLRLTKIRGIGDKRAEQLKALGINNLEDLANASAKDLAVKLNISPKMTGRWIDSAKQLTTKS